MTTKMFQNLFFFRFVYDKGVERLILHNYIFKAYKIKRKFMTVIYLYLLNLYRS